MKTPEERSEYNKKWYIKNKEKRTKQLQEYRINNKEKIKEYHDTHKEERKIRYSKNEEKIKEKRKEYTFKNKEKIKEKRKEYNIKNKEKNKKYSYEYIKNRLKNDNLFKSRLNISNLIRQSIKKYGYTKKSKTQEILGCSFEEFKKHLESKFEPWMNWDNYGKYNGELNHGWDIDHIIPSSSAANEDELIKLNHYINLQPLCSKINRDIKKGNI
jgi:hypothetical protein